MLSSTRDAWCGPTAARNTAKTATSCWAPWRAVCFFVAYTVRGETVRLISARKANEREVKAYENGAIET